MIADAVYIALYDRYRGVLKILNHAIMLHLIVMWPLMRLLIAFCFQPWLQHNYPASLLKGFFFFFMATAPLPAKPPAKFHLSFPLRKKKKRKKPKVVG